MRPIDADALKVSAKGISLFRTYDAGLPDLRALVDSAPTLDYAPVVHGRWILDSFPPRHMTVDGYLICNKCNSHFYRIKGTMFKRCPSCGAKMGGGTKNGEND